MFIATCPVDKVPGSAEPIRRVRHQFDMEGNSLFLRRLSPVSCNGGTMEPG